MSLRIRRGTESQRLATVAEAGEILWTTDQRKLWVGTGASNNPGNASMVNVGKGLAGSGLVWNDTDQVLEVGNFSITTTDVPEGTNLYFRTDRAQTATQAMFTSVDATHTGISFLYNDIDQTVNATVSLSIDDLSDVQIVGTPATNSVLKYNGASWTASTDTVGMTSVADDTSPKLGGDLDLNSHNITGVGNISVTGNNNLSGVTDGIIGPNMPSLILRGFRGTNSVPNNTQAGDAVGRIGFLGLYNGTYVPSANIYAGWEVGATMTDAYPASKIAFITNAGGNGYNVGVFDSKGVLTLPAVSVADGTDQSPSIRFTTDGGQDSGFFHPGDGIVCLSINATEKVRVDSGGMRVDGFMKVKDVTGNLPSPPEAGMIVLDSGVFKGYTGSGWVVLG